MSEVITATESAEAGLVMVDQIKDLLNQVQIELERISASAQQQQPTEEKVVVETKTTRWLGAIIHQVFPLDSEGNPTEEPHPEVTMVQIFDSVEEATSWTTENVNRKLRDGFYGIYGSVLQLDD